jgi:hypothetical protein
MATVERKFKRKRKAARAS